jgi:hypothetical protein
VPHQVRVENLERFLRVTAEGEITADDVQAMIAKVAADCRSLNQVNVLIDIRDVRGGIDLFDCLGFAETIAASVIGSGIRMAFVYRLERDGGRMPFIETAAVNRGAVLKAFPDAGAAERWLSADSITAAS